MKITRLHLRIALYVLGAALVLFTVLKLLFPAFSLGPTIDHNLPTFVMIGAMVIFFWHRDLWKKEQYDAEQARLADEARRAGEVPAVPSVPKKES